jgi:hypothetical protein
MCCPISPSILFNFTLTLSPPDTLTHEDPSHGEGAATANLESMGMEDIKSLNINAHK